MSSSLDLAIKLASNPLDKVSSKGTWVSFNLYTRQLSRQEQRGIQKVMAIRKRSVLTVVSEKGGVGKSFTAVNLSAGLAQRGYRVVVVDTDPNGSTSWWTQGDVEPQQNVGNLMLNPQQNVNDYLIDLSGNGKLFDRSNGGSLFLIPSGPNLGTVNNQLVGGTGAERRLLRALRPIKDVDFIVIDCQSSMDSKLTQNAVVACDYTLMIAVPEWLSFVASVETVEHLRRIRADNEQDFNLLGIVFNRAEDSQEHRKTLAEAREQFGDKIFETVIPNYKSFSSRPRAAASYLSLGSQQQSVLDAFVDELISKLGV